MYFGSKVYRCVWVILVTCLGWNIAAQTPGKSTLSRQKDLVDKISQSTFERNSRSGTCDRIVGSIYGDPDSDERGYCLIPNALNDGLYVAGSKDNKILILEVDLDGEVRWSRTFDLFPGGQEHPFAIILDSDGMLAIAGASGVISVGGVTFILRYDPQNHQVLWTKEYESVPNADSDGIIQKGIGGNYLMANNLNVGSGNHIDTEILEIDKNTGDVIPSFSKRYRLSNRESLLEIVYDGEFVYGTGRYRNDGDGNNFRNAIVKLDPDNGSQIWAKLGHIPQSQTARLYGSHLLIDNSAIISGCYGDSAGLSTTDSKLFLQKTNLDGDLIWIRKYELFGTNVYCLGIIKSGNGYVILGSKKSPETSLIMFKIDTDGKLLWSNTYQFPGIQEALINPTIGIRGNSKVIEAGNKLVFTGYVTNASGNNDLLIVQTDLEGWVDNQCTRSEPFQIVVSPVSSPVFYDFQQTISISTPQVAANAVQGIVSLIQPIEECTSTESIQNTLEISICDTESYEGYTLPGIYQDTFHLSGGCDSIRTLKLSVISCGSDCSANMASIYGDPGLDERGYCLVATPQKDGIYVAGTKNDSTLIVRFDLNGKVIWSKTFDIIPNVKEAPVSILLDSEGMLAIAGVAYVAPGNVTGYIFRYDPLTHAVLWSKNYRHTEREYFSSIIQKGPGGNYIVVGTHSQAIANHDDADVLEIDKNIGTINPAFAKGFTLWGTEGLYEIVYDGQFLYATGRYKDKGPFTLEMRNTITKLDPNNGNPIWVRLGHKPPNQSARLYGTHLLVDGDKIISGYHGDPNGQSTTNTKVFFQLTDHDGNFRWIKQYEIPGNNDLCHAVTKSGDGYVFLLGQKTFPSGLYLVKIDENGQVQWAKSIVLPDFINEVDGGGGNLKLIEAGVQLFLTANGINSSGKSDLLLISTDLNGVSNLPCVSTIDVQVTAVDVPGAVFYEVLANEFYVSLNTSSAGLTPVDNTLKPREECIVRDTLFDAIEGTICQGQSFAGYTDPGVYEDFFITADGCDSSRTLTLIVLPPLNTFINNTICDGESYLGYTTAGTYIDTFTTLDGCDSIRTLFLDVGLPSVSPTISFCEGSYFENYNEGGFYIDTLTGSTGCDTVRHLTLIETPAIQTVLDITICSGAEYAGYTVEGFYVDTFQTTDGCDSIRILQLSVMSEIKINKDIQICLGDVYDGYTQEGTYPDTLQSVFGCDSIIQLQLTVVPEEKFMTVDVCEGGSFEQYSLPGQYIDTIQGSTSACDTIRHITLNVLQAETTNISYTICAEDHFNGHTEPGKYSDTLITVDGCITIQTVLLSVREPITSYTKVSLCDGSIQEHHGPGIIIDTLISSLGCDSIRTLSIEGPAKYIPNAFSPNQDGNNDLFEIFASSDTNIDLDYFAIFDRFGDMTYETSVWPVLWDGNRLNGQPHPSGVYAYVLIYQCGDERIIEHGNITLVK